MNLRMGWVAVLLWLGTGIAVSSIASGQQGADNASGSPDSAELDSLRAIDSLEKLLASESPRVRAEAAGALGRVLLATDVKIRDFSLLLLDNDSAVRAAAARAFVDSPRPAALPLLQHALQDRDPRVQFLAVIALHEFLTNPWPSRTSRLATLYRRNG